MTDNPFMPIVVLELADDISKAMLTGKPAAVVGAVLAELMGRLLANFDEAAAESLLALHLQTVRELEAVNRKLLPKGWREEHGDKSP